MDTASTEVALKRKITDTLHEYTLKVKETQNEIAVFEKSCERLRTASCIGGTYGIVHIDTGKVYLKHIEESLLKSAWLNIYAYLNIDSIVSAKYRKKFQQSIEDPPEFTIENIRASFGDFILDPYHHILRGLAEVFCSIDDSYKSHNKVKRRVHYNPVKSSLGYGF